VEEPFANTLVVVLTTVTTQTPLASVAVGASNTSGWPAAMVLFVQVVSVGGVVSTTEMVWTALVLLPHASVTVQLRVMIWEMPQRLLTASV
jgi:hypothetical protein